MSKRKLSDLIIFSDVDGTLLNIPHPVSRRNIEALERFVAKGGRFALATGRSLIFCGDLYKLLPVNFPCIIFNGGGIYDFKKDEYIYRRLMPEGYTEYLRAVMERFPTCGAMSVDNNNYHDVLGSVSRSFPDIIRNGVERSTSFDCLGRECFKCMFFIEKNQVDIFCEFVKEKNFPGVRVVKVSEGLIEMLPEGSSKGNALERLVAMTGTARENLVAIGDYYNDREMIVYAGIGVTMHTAPDDLKALAQIHVCECEKDSLADLVERLEEMFES